MRKLLVLILAFALLIPGALAEIRHEGPGYDTPEEAVLAYVEALNRGDVDDMLATFALETFVDNCDTDAYLLRMQSINPMAIYGVPVSGAYSRSLLINARRAQINNILMQQYMVISAALKNTVHPLEDSAARAEMEARFADSPANAWEGTAQFVRWINPALVDEKLALPINLVNAAMQTAHYGADDIDWKIAHLTLGGAPAILFMQCAKYGDRWYNGELSGMPGMMMNLPVTSAGMVIEGVMDDYVDLSALYNPLLSFMQTEGSALLDANAASDLAGTRWQLARVDGADVTVVSDAEEAAQDDGRSAWAELKLMRLGALLDVRLGAELIHEKEEPRMLVGMAWRDRGDAPELLMIRWRGPDTDQEDSRLERSGDELILTIGNGISLVFTRK